MAFNENTLGKVEVIEEEEEQQYYKYYIKVPMLGDYLYQFIIKGDGICDKIELRINNNTIYLEDIRKKDENVHPLCIFKDIDKSYPAFLTRTSSIVIIVHGKYEVLPTLSYMMVTGKVDKQILDCNNFDITIGRTLYNDKDTIYDLQFKMGYPILTKNSGKFLARKHKVIVSDYIEITKQMKK